MQIGKGVCTEVAEQLVRIRDGEATASAKECSPHTSTEGAESVLTLIIQAAVDTEALWISSEVRRVLQLQTKQDAADRISHPALFSPAAPE